MNYPRYESMTIEQWENAFSFDHDNPSRKAAAASIFGILTDLGVGQSLAELGFYSAYDWRTWFKEWHDAGLIKYVGYDTWHQFVLYAQEKWPDYDWRRGSAEDMDECDISYARHVAMTMAPRAWPYVLATLLQKSRKACVVTYRLPPRNDEGHFVHHIDERSGRDVWTNRYPKKAILEIYDKWGFDVVILRAGEEEIYVARRM